MNIELQPVENSSLRKIININIEKYTVLAGENNSGKTTLVKAILEQLGGVDNIIYIPAENIDPKENLKTSAGTHLMTKAILKLLEVSLDQDPVIEGEYESLFKSIENVFSSFDVKNTRLNLNEKNITKAQIEKWVKEKIAQTVLDTEIIDSYYGGDTKLNIDQVGQGVQRMIIVSVLQEIGKKNISSEEETIMLFEEPEIYLHPKLKEKLFDSLIKISENTNIRIVVTTHDPYFIQLSAGKNVYVVDRDQDGATFINDQINKYLPNSWRSFSEINYQVFGVNSNDYLNELYGYVENVICNNKWRRVDTLLEEKGQTKNQARAFFTDLNPEDKITIGSAIRHEIHHPTQETVIDATDVNATISILQNIISDNNEN